MTVALDMSKTLIHTNVINTITKFIANYIIAWHYILKYHFSANMLIISFTLSHPSIISSHFVVFIWKSNTFTLQLPTQITFDSSTNSGFSNKYAKASSMT